MMSYPGLFASGYFIQTHYHVRIIPIHDVAQSTTMLVGNNRIILMKANAIVNYRSIDGMVQVTGSSSTLPCNIHSQRTHREFWRLIS